MGSIDKNFIKIQLPAVDFSGITLIDFRRTVSEEILLRETFAGGLFSKDFFRGLPFREPFFLIQKKPYYYNTRKISIFLIVFL